MIALPLKSADKNQSEKRTVIIHDIFTIRELTIEKIYEIIHKLFHNKINTQFIETKKPQFLKLIRNGDHLRQSLNPIRQRRRVRPRHIPSIFVINLKEGGDFVSVDTKISVVEDYEKLQYSQYKHLRLENIRKNWYNYVIELRILLNENLEEKLDLSFPNFNKSPVNQ